MDTLMGRSENGKKKYFVPESLLLPTTKMTKPQETALLSVWPTHFWSFPSEVEEGSDGCQNEAWFNEGRVVDQSVDVAHEKVEHRQNSLRKRRVFI